MNVGAAPAVWGAGGRGGAADEPRQAAHLPHHRDGQAGGPLTRHRAGGGLCSQLKSTRLPIVLYHDIGLV